MTAHRRRVAEPWGVLEVGDVAGDGRGMIAMAGGAVEDRTDPWTTRREAWHLHPDDARDDYAVDHSGSFRRLQVKTQILNLGESDFYRTRLTHTLKVARIASNVAR